MTESKKNTPTNSTPICVRVSNDELERLKSDSTKTRKTMPTLLRETYFNKIPQNVLMNDDDVEKIRAEINRIGNNVNQIAKQINAGIRHGWNSSFDSISEQLKLLNQYYVLNYGVHKS